jgi:hypothetical protein
MAKELVERVDDMYEVARCFMTGKTVKETAEKLGISTSEVHYLQGQWTKHMQKMAAGNMDLHNRLMAILMEVSEHYKLLEREAWAVIEEERKGGDNRVAVSAIKAQAGILKDKTDMFAKMGMQQNSELMLRLRQAEEAQEVLVDILKEVLCGGCRPIVMRRLQEVTPEAEVLEVKDVK